MSNKANNPPYSNFLLNSQRRSADGAIWFGSSEEIGILRFDKDIILTRTIPSLNDIIKSIGSLLSKIYQNSIIYMFFLVLSSPTE